MQSANVVVFFAGMCTIFAFLPQVIKVVKTKSTESISLTFLVIMIFGTALWIFYGIRINDKAIFIANSSTFAMSCIILKYKVMNVLNRKDKI